MVFVLQLSHLGVHMGPLGCRWVIGASGWGSGGQLGHLVHRCIVRGVKRLFVDGFRAVGRSKLFGWRHLRWKTGQGLPVYCTVLAEYSS